jgi:ATP-dependent RNA helicase RhlE
LGYQVPTPIQERAIPVALRGRDLLGLAQTGTGKTAAFALPILEKLEKLSAPAGRIERHSGKRISRALIIVPTRELADQIDNSVKNLAANTKIRSTTLYGGVSKKRQDEALANGTDIIVACPGRLLDHIGEETVDLSALIILVIDEADTMFDMGFLPDIRRILGHLPAERQTLFFAATMQPEIRALTSEILHEPETVQIGVIAPARTVSHSLYPTTDEMKKRMLTHLLDRTATGRVMIFTRTKRRARFLALDLQKVGLRVAPLQGNMSQNKRQNAINGFRNGKYDILVATDIASRGIDVSEVTHVINFDMPNTVDNYIHRIGRTGRSNKNGEAFTFCTSEDEALVKRVERILESEIERKILEGFDYGGFSPSLNGTHVINRTESSEHNSKNQNRRGSYRHNRSTFSRNKQKSVNGKRFSSNHLKKTSKN